MSRHSRVSFHGPDPIEGAEHLTSIGVSFVPVDYPQLVITWTYVLRDGEILFPSGMRVEPWPALPVEERLHVGASFVRDLPTAKLERAARLAVELHYAGIRPEQLPSSSGTSPEEISEAAHAMVRERWPDLDPEAGAAAARRWKRLVRLAEVVQEHQEARAQGEKSPAAVVAKARGVEPGTVRSWLHQARQEGFAPSVMPTGKFMAEVISDAHPGGEIWED